MNYLKEIFYLLGSKRAFVPLLVMLFLLSSFFDLIGLGLIVPYTLLITSSEIITNETLKLIFENLNISYEKNTAIYFLSALLLFVFIIKAAASILVNMVIIRFSMNFQVDMKTRLMSIFQNMSYPEYVNRNSSEYITTIVKLVPQFSMQVLQSFLKMLSEGITFLVIILFLAFKNGPVLIFLLIYLGTISLIYDRIFRKLIRLYGAESNKHDILMVQGIKEGIEGIKEIRVLGVEKYFLENVKNNAEKYSEYNSKTLIIRLIPNYLIELLLLSFIIIFVVITLYQQMNMQYIIPTLSLFAFAAIRLKPSVNSILNSISLMRSGRDSTHRLYNEFNKLDDGSAFLLDISKPSQEKFIFNELELNNVSFKYDGSMLDALHNINFKLYKGESIGLIGSSGSGKTTLVDTILGFLQPQSGNILFNNEPIDKNLKEWRRNVAYIPQQVILIDNSLRCNVALGVPENEIDEQRVISAIEQARIGELVRQLPKGLNTVLGERGIRLSGGQRQRVALARAFYHGRNVLVMDEATSALDNKTEKEIVDQIKRLKGLKSLIVIAHRLTTVKHCDRIYRLEKGEIVDQGSYASVIGT